MSNKILKIKNNLNKRNKILILVGILLTSGSITGGFIYKFIFAQHVHTLNQEDVISFPKAVNNAFAFEGFDGSGTLRYNGQNISQKVFPKFTKAFKSEILNKDSLKEKDFNLKLNEVKNLRNNDIVYVKFFSINNHKYHLSKKLKTIFSLKAFGLKTPVETQDLSTEIDKYQDVTSDYSSSQLYDKFSNKSKDLKADINDLKILNDSLPTLDDNLKREFKFEGWDTTNKYLKLKVVLSQKNPKYYVKLKNNEKIITVKPSNDYSYIQEIIDSNSTNQVFTYAPNSKYDPSVMFNNLPSGQTFPQDFSLENYYGYSLLSSNISRNINIQKYNSVSWDANSSTLSVSAQITDTKAPYDLIFKNNTINIDIKLIDDNTIASTPHQVINELQRSASITNPGNSSFNYSKLKDLFDRKGQGYKLESEDFGFWDMPIANKLNDDYFLEAWDSTNNLLELKVRVEDTSDASINPEETSIFIKGSDNLISEKQIVDDFFFNNRDYNTNQTDVDLNNFFTSKQVNDEIDLTDPNFILKYKKPDKLTKGIDIKFEFLKWDQNTNNLDLNAVLTDTNAPSNANPSNNKVKITIKITPKYDFTADLAKFNSTFNSQMTFSELFDKFNSNDGTVAKNAGDYIAPSSFGYKTPILSKNSIEANYELVSWDQSSKELQIKVTLEDKDSPDVNFTNNTKILNIQGSTNLSKQLSKVDNSYTAFAKRTAIKLQTYFSAFKQDQKFDFENEFPTLNYKTPNLIEGIGLEYKFVEYKNNILSVKAVLTDSHAPSGSTFTNSEKNIQISIVPAYSYASIVEEFKEAIPKEIASLNGTELYDIFYTDGKANYNRGDIVNPDDFQYTDRILLPKNINATYKFNEWDHTTNLLKIDVSLKNNDISDLIEQLNEDFTLEFYGTNDLQHEKAKIESKISNSINLDMWLTPHEQENWINTNLPINQEFSYKKIKNIFNYQTFNSDWNDFIDSAGFNDLTKGIDTFWTRKSTTKDSGNNLILNFKIRIDDEYMYKNLPVKNNIINNLQIRFIPKFNIDFLDDFIYQIGVPKPTSLYPRGIIDLSDEPWIKPLSDYKRGWNWSAVDSNRWYYTNDFFKEILWWNGYDWNYSDHNKWSFNNLFRKRNLIDSNTGNIAFEDDYDIRLQVLGYDDSRKSVVTKISFEFKGRSRTKYGFPQDMNGDLKTEVWRKLYFKIAK